MFYHFRQNNSYGYFVTDEYLCKNLFIEANSEEEAIKVAESLGCYWDGVEEGIDCPCCGDRWDKSPYKIDDIPLKVVVCSRAKRKNFLF